MVFYVSSFLFVFFFSISTSKCCYAIHKLSTCSTILQYWIWKKIHRLFLHSNTCFEGLLKIVDAFAEMQCNQTPENNINRFFLSFWRAKKQIIIRGVHSSWHAILKYSNNNYNPKSALKWNISWKRIRIRIWVQARVRNEVVTDSKKMKSSSLNNEGPKSFQRRYEMKWFDKYEHWHDGNNVYFCFDKSLSVFKSNR